MSKKLKYQLLAVASVILVAGLGSLFVNLGMDWFNGLSKPAQWIPNILIPIVWTVVYLLASYVLWRNIKEDEMDKKRTFLFVINGFLNVLWCLVFFALNLTLLGNIVIIFNLIFGWLLVTNLFKIDNWQNKLMIIYSIWLSIATSLNLCLWILN